MQTCMDCDDLGATKGENLEFRKKKNRDFQFYATVMFVKEYLLK